LKTSTKAIKIYVTPSDGTLSQSKVTEQPPTEQIKQTIVISPIVEQSIVKTVQEVSSVSKTEDVATIV